MSRRTVPSTRPKPGELAVVNHGLPGWKGDSGSAATEQLAELASWAAEHRLTGLLYECMVAADLDVPPIVAELHLGTLRQAVSVEVEACRAIGVLRRSGLEPIVFKGVAAAHLDYADPAQRTFYDVDIIVARAEFASAMGALDAGGWSHVESPLGATWERRFARAAQFISPSGIEVDLHASLAAGFFGVRLDHDRLWAATETFDLGGVAITAMHRDARLLSSCCALVLSRGGNLRLVRDVAQQIMVSGASWEGAAEIGGDSNVVIAAALDLVGDWIELPADAATWARTITARPMQRVGLRLARRAETAGWRSDAVGEVLGLANRERVAYVGGWLVNRSRSTRDSPR